MPLFEILRDFLADQLNLDNRLLRSLRALALPGKLTQIYFSGRRKSLMNPFRFFFVVALLCFASIKITQREKLTLDRRGIAEMMWFANKAQAFEVIDSLSMTFERNDKMDSFLTDSILPFLRRQFLIDKDSVDLNANIRVGFEEDGPFIVSVRDFNLLSTEELVDKYSQGSLLRKVFRRQKIKMLKDPLGYVNFIVNNSTWMLICFIPVIALVLKLLYIRRSRYYIEHLVFSSHLHTAFFIFISLVLILAMRTEMYMLIMMGLILFSIYLYLSLLRYYRQGSWKTLLKCIVLHILYPLLFTFFAIFSLILSMLFL